MKKFISLLLVISMIAAAGLQVLGAVQVPITIKVNGKVVIFKDVKPYMQNGLKAPIREIAEAMGAKVSNESLTADVVVTRGKVKMVYQANKKSVLINGKSYTMLDSVVVKNKRTVVPVRFFVENIGGKLVWDAKTNTANVTIAALPKPVEVVIPKAKTEFKPWIPELTPIDTNTLNVLKKYKGNDGEEPDNFMYMTNEELIQRWGFDDIKGFAELAKGYIESKYSVDYRTLDENFVKQMKYFYMPGTWGGPGKVSSFLTEYAKDIIKYKVVAKCEFITDTSLMYKCNRGDYRVKGRQKVRFYSADEDFFTKNNLPKLKLNTWYQWDREVGFAHLFGQGEERWEHSKYTLCSYNDLSECTEIK